MAVEIKEIVIKAVLTPKEAQKTSKAQAPIDQDAVVQECVNQVLKVLQKKTRR